MYEVNSLDVSEAIRGRRSVRRYKPDPVPRELVERCLEAAAWAPSAMNGQQWRFTVLTGGAKEGFTGFFRAELERIQPLRGEKGMGGSFRSCAVMEQAPVVVVVWNAGPNGWESEAQGVCAAIQNLLLEAYSLGLGSLWIADIHYAHRAVTEYLGKPWRLTAAVALGYPGEEEKTKQPPARKPLSEIAEFRA